jgi:hypothetical protein
VEEELLLIDQAAIAVLDAVVQLDVLITVVCISYFKLHNIDFEISLLLLSLFTEYSYGYWITFFSIMARSQGLYVNISS